MSGKKWIVLGLASVASLASTTTLSAPRDQNIYVGAGAGAFDNRTYKLTPWTAESGTRKLGSLTIRTTLETSTTDHVPLGLAATAWAGYQFNRHWAVQLGYYWNHQQKLAGNMDVITGVLPTFTNDTVQLKLNSHNLYLAVRGMLSFTNNFSGYLMAGPAQTFLKQKTYFTTYTTSDDTQSDNFTTWMAGVGLQYEIGYNLALSLQYSYIAAHHENDNSHELRYHYKGTQYAMLGLTYAFPIGSSSSLSEDSSTKTKKKDAVDSLENDPWLAEFVD
jgi:opacity protein-like surface antigen